ncbi:hypothetical protein [Noviherbaspirillum galbum]|uniref:Uncharacterized protein n=1 Tax=Noviherbaspirillum galbum TaxID=2709383 RepID=A0A6B3SNK6_9BURK|nr:hypothetical protein [Noviherbaspirillum galbum]NEX60032.1 hypothetical protein [Noviherbaspirillum galbum]
MSQFDHNMSQLFRSVAADRSEDKSASSTLAQEAEQRWPLLKTMRPAKPEDTPPLHPRARQHIGPPGRPAASARKQALTLPSLGDKLAESLNKMAAGNVSARSPLTAPPPDDDISMNAVDNHASAPARQDGARALFARASEAQDEQEDMSEARGGLGMFAKRAAKPQPAPQTVAPPAEMPRETRDGSLFGRPAAAPVQAAQPAQANPERPGMFGRRAEAAAPEERPGLFARRAPAAPVEEGKPGLFGKRSEEAQPARQPIAEPVKDKNLSSVFARLEEKDDDAPEPSQSRGSLFGWFGKR